MTVIKDPGRWSDSSELSELERELLEAAMRDRIPTELKLRMAQALRASLSGGGSAAPLAGSSANAGQSWLFSAKALTVGLASAVLIGGAVGWQVSRGSRAETQVAAALPPMAAAAPARPAAIPELASQPRLLERAPAASLPVARSDREREDAPAREANNATLRAEIALLDAARDALQRETPMLALELLTRHARRFRRGALAPEAAALRIEALDQAGERTRARVLARRFLADHPASPLGARVQRIAAAAP
jgi:hypothetical protein